jgi:hypothetical protein
MVPDQHVAEWLDLRVLGFRILDPDAVWLQVSLATAKKCRPGLVRGLCPDLKAGQQGDQNGDKNKR